MALSARYLPQATPLDPAEDPPGSIDPLGTLGPAERIAEALMPGFTARMWRPRLLTFAAVASLVAERVGASGAGSEVGGLAATLGFERLFVSAIVRQQMRERDEWSRAARRLPGRTLAQRALHSDDTPLGRNNFLKGQAINGPFGVMARLARRLGIVDEDDRLAREGENLLLAWSGDERLSGLLDEQHSNSPGHKWLDRFVQATKDHVRDKWWPSAGWSGWYDLAVTLRPDKIGSRERKVLRRLLDSDPIRARCLALLSEPKAVATYRDARDGGRGQQDRKVLLEAVLPMLSVHEHEEDRVIDFAIRLADAYEQVANLLETVFDGFRWGLTRRGGQATAEELQADRQLRPVFQSVCKQLGRSARLLCELIKKIPSVPRVADLKPIEPVDDLAAEALAAAESPARLVETVIARHRRVQNSKGKAMWIDVSDRWTLLPGFGLSSDAPPEVPKGYLHPFRVPNAYSFLGDLGLRGVEVPDEKA